MIWMSTTAAKTTPTCAAASLRFDPRGSHADELHVAGALRLVLPELNYQLGNLVYQQAASYAHRPCLLAPEMRAVRGMVEGRSS